MIVGSLVGGECAATSRGLMRIVKSQDMEAPSLDPQKGMLHLKGYFPGQPIQINFELLYQAVDGRWRLFGLSVQPSGPKAPPQASSEPKR